MKSNNTLTSLADENDKNTVFKTHTCEETSLRPIVSQYDFIAPYTSPLHPQK
jgi:hypothetical protein